MYNMSCEKLDGVTFSGTMYKTQLNLDCGEIEKFVIPVEFYISQIDEFVLKIVKTNLSSGHRRTSLYIFDGINVGINGPSFSLSSSSVDNGSERIEIQLTDHVLIYKLSQRNCDISLTNAIAELVPDKWID